MKKKKDYNFINLKYMINNDIPTIKEYLKYNGTNFNDDDINSLISFATELSQAVEHKILKQFIAGYTINRLEKEFDLIKMDENNIINIELKTTYEDLTQAAENYKILNVFHQNSNIYIFCYCKSNNRIYLYNNKTKSFIESNMNTIKEKLEELIFPTKIDIDFKVYSLYKNPTFFLNNEYCLSKSQTSALKSIRENLNGKNIIIQGDAGTGKSLLALYLHKELSSVSTSAFLAPIKVYSIINNDLVNKYKISTVKDFILKKEKYDYIIIDEAQNLTEGYIKQLKELCNKNIILLGDRLQDIKNCGYFDKLCADKNNKIINLKKCIRTNNTFVTFAKQVLNIDVSKKTEVDKSKIEIKMIDDDYELKEYVFIEPIKPIYFEKCTRNNECNHKNCLKFKFNSAALKSFNDIDTCSLEYDKVVIYLCDSYKLIKDAHGNEHIVPTKKSTFNNFEKEFYLMITRAVSKLLIITDDLKIYNYLMSKKENLNK